MPAFSSMGSLVPPQCLAMYFAFSAVVPVTFSQRTLMLDRRPSCRWTARSLLRKADVFHEAGLFPSDAEAVVTFSRTIVLAREAGRQENCDVWATFEDLCQVVGR